MLKSILKIILPFGQNSNLTNFQIFTNGLSVGFLLFILAVFGIGAYQMDYGIPHFAMLLIGILFGLLIFILTALFFKFLIPYISNFSKTLTISILSTIFTLTIAKIIIFPWPTLPFFLGSAVGLLSFGILFWSIGLLKYKNNKLPWLGLISSFLIIGFFLIWIINEGLFQKNTYAIPKPSDSLIKLSSLGIANPSDNGNIAFKYFTYGSGSDVKRKEYGSGAKLISPTVDATKLLPEWKEKKKKWREKYWKFGAANFPLNGKVTMPEGSGPYPLVLIVHGNHSMIDYSDDGYSYLAQMLASRGFITISIDENFINGHWSGDFMGKEMPTRAWLLLKHLELLNTWNATENNDFYGKIDMDNIVLIGHSRGGEAVSIAAAYNHLDNFPDNALEKFDFHFNIKGIITIAPTDYRYHRKINLQDLNYLSLQGSYDSDESSFWGFRPYNRLVFSEKDDFFKAAVFIHGANHGQFNSTWDRSDMGAPMKWLLNIKPIISRVDQEQIAKIYISSFIEATLHNDEQWLPIFKNSDLGREWLPDNIYLTNFQSSKHKIIADFEEDINPFTSSSKAFLKGENLKIWKEEELLTRDKEKQDNNVLTIGWNYGKLINKDSIAQFTISLVDSIEQMNALSISVAQGNSKELESLSKEKLVKDQNLDFQIILKDENGNESKIKISKIKPISKKLKVQFGKERSLSKRYGEDWEAQLESYFIPISAFEPDSAFQMHKTKEISFVFDQCLNGLIHIDNIGYE